MIEGWRTAWEKSDFDAYSSYYSNDFSAAKMNKKAWLSLKSSLKERRGDSIQVNLTQPGIVAFEDQLLALFKQNYSSSETTDTGYKFLYMKWEGDRYRILSEKWIHIDTVEQLAQTKRSGSGKLSKR